MLYDFLMESMTEAMLETLKLFGVITVVVLVALLVIERRSR